MNTRLTPAPEVDPLIGRHLADKYEVLGVIGRGGLGTVYKGVQHPVGREVAIKVIARHRAGDEVLRRRFQREAHAAARLKHPAIVALFDFGEDDGELFMVMEFVEGRELRDLLRKGQPMDPERVVGLMTQVLAGLAHAHHAGLVHRDLKPENIMVSEGPFGGERAQILDFGIVKAMREDATSVPESHETRAGVIMGTPAYLAPEQAYARGVGPHTDQYSLGVVIYEALTGKLPYDRGTEFEIMTAHCVAPYPPMPPEAGVSPALEAVVRRAMAKDPDDRFPSVREMIEALKAALEAGGGGGGAGDGADEVVLLAAPEGAVGRPGPTPMEIPSLSTGEHRALLAASADEPLPTKRIALFALGVLALGSVALWAVLPPSEAGAGAPDAAAVTAQPAPSDATAVTRLVLDAGAAPALTAGLGGQAVDPLDLDPDAGAAPASAAASVASAPPKRPATRAPRRRVEKPKPPRRVKATRLDPTDCQTEWTALRAEAAGKSLSKGSGLCRRISQLERRVTAGRCKTPIAGIDMLMSLCE